MTTTTSNGIEAAAGDFNAGGDFANEDDDLAGAAKVPDGDKLLPEDDNDDEKGVDMSFPESVEGADPYNDEIGDDILMKDDGDDDEEVEAKLSSSQPGDDRDATVVVDGGGKKDKATAASVEGEIVGTTPRGTTITADGPAAGGAAVSAAASKPPTPPPPAPPPPRKGKKRGGKVGGTKRSFSAGFWYDMCKQYRDEHNDLTRVAFLRSEFSPPEMTGTKSQLVSFARYLNMYDEGNLVKSERKRAPVTNPSSTSTPRKGSKKSKTTAGAAAADADTSKDPDEPRKKKPGGKIGGKKNSFTSGAWYEMCKNYRDNHREMNMTDFLRSSYSPAEVTGTQSQRMSFSRYLKLYDSGTLVPSAMKRRRASKFEAVEIKTAQYIKIRQQFYGQQDRKGLTWGYVQQKALQWADLEDDEAYEQFEASSQWITNLFRRHDIVDVTLRGDSCEDDDADRMEEWKEIFHAVIDKGLYSRDRVYGANETGLFYRKLPTAAYASVSMSGMTAQCDVQAAKELKADERITVMMCTSAAGKKAPLAVLGKSENPISLQYYCDGNSSSRGGRRPPVPYRAQEVAWFDKESTYWWINEVFWPWHLSIHSGEKQQQKNKNKKALLVLNHCPAHTDLDVSRLPASLSIINMPNNLTYDFHPGNMGLVTALKVAYKSQLLKQYLTIFDLPGGYEDAAWRRSRAPRGCGGLNYGGMATLSDAIHILDRIWDSSDGDDDSRRQQRGNGVNVVVADGDFVEQCWSKSDVLPAKFNQEIGAGSGNGKEPNESVSDEDCDMISSLLRELESKMSSNGVDAAREAYGLKRSILEEDDNGGRGLPEMSKEQLAAIVSNWVDIEDKEIVIEAEVDDLVARIVRGDDQVVTGGDDDDDNNDGGGDPFAGVEEEEDNNIATAAASSTDTTSTTANMTFLEAMNHVDVLLDFARENNIVGDYAKQLHWLKERLRTAQVDEQLLLLLPDRQDDDNNNVNVNTNIPAVMQHVAAEMQQEQVVNHGGEEVVDDVDIGGALVV